MGSSAGPTAHLSCSADDRDRGADRQAPLVRSGYWRNGLRRASSVTLTARYVRTGPDLLAPPEGGRRKLPQLGLHLRTDVAPRGSAREARAAEDSTAIGGMRHPRLAVDKIPGLRPAGAVVREALESYLDSRPDVSDSIEASIAEGTCRVPESALKELANRLGKVLHTGKIGKGPKSLWRAGFVQAFVSTAGDPDTALGQWLEHGAPTGVAKDVECLGIFPRTTPKGLLHDDIWKQWALGEPTANYTSIHENEGIVRAEIRRLAAKGYVTVYPNLDAVLRRFGNVVVSKMAAVVTLRKCGAVKLRLIVDMLRSHVNDHVRLHERIVLPRIQDLISDAVHFASFDDPEDDMDMMVVDWEDAFHSMGVIDEELPHQVVKGFDGEYIGYETVLFGGAGSPGVWGRGAAFLGRSGAALFRPDEVRLQIYVDAPWSIWRGARATRRRNRAMLLLWWLVLGPPLSWKKVQIGRNIRWIGVCVQLKEGFVHVTLDEAFVLDLATEVTTILGLAWVSAGRLKKLVGKAKWAAGIIPYFKAFIMPLWAATSDAPGGRVGVRRILYSLLWLRAFLRRTRGGLERVYHPGDCYAPLNLVMELDASPWGYGGVLYLGGVAKSWFAEAISKEDVARFDIVVGEAKFQALLEVLAVLIGLRTWAGIIGNNRWAACVRSDSQAASGAAFKLRSPVPAINSVVREVALDLAESKYGIDFIEHLPGRCNVHADVLSRFYQPGKSRDVPPEIAGASRAWPAKRSFTWWETAGDPEGRTDPIERNDLDMMEDGVPQEGCSEDVQEEAAP